MDHMELIKALIVFGADVEIHNDLGETPGLIAARTSKGEREEREEGGKREDGGEGETPGLKASRTSKGERDWGEGSRGKGIE